MEHQNSSLESWKEFSLTWEQRASSWAFTECLAYLGPPHLRSQPSQGTYIPGLGRESTKAWPPHPSWGHCEGPRKPQSSWHCLPAPQLDSCFHPNLLSCIPFHSCKFKRCSLRNILPTKLGLRGSPFPRDRFVTVKRGVVETPGTQDKEERKVQYYSCLESEKGLLYLYTLHSPQGPTKAPWLGRLMSKNSCVKNATPNPTSCDLGPSDSQSPCL